MAENTTGDSVRIVGEQRPHPAVKHLARACIALVRWQRQRSAETPAAATVNDATVDQLPVVGGRDHA